METIKLTITQLNTLIKRIIDAEEYLQPISVYGEVSNFKISAGNAYFDIKEDGAQIACIKFGANYLDIKNGDMVLLTGKLNYYVKTGKLSFIASSIEPYGLGNLYKQYLALKEKLSAEGLFDERYKKQLPRYAKKVGVVTSETGAVIRDIVHVAKKKNPYTDILVYPAKVQGLNAENEIIAGINYFENSDVDVIIIARGGGSFEDLAPFNTEVLARAIFSCAKPIISAVGHETDFSLSDFVADMRAPTPSVAAEIAFFDYFTAKQDLTNLIDYIKNQTTAIISSKQQEVVGISNNLLNIISNLHIQNNLKLKNLTDQIISSYSGVISKHKLKLNTMLTSIDKSNPLNILKNGYAVVQKQDCKIVSKSQVQIGDLIKITVADGKIDAKVVDKEN